MEHRDLKLATERAKRRAGRAWDSVPHIRDSLIAAELLAIFAGKDASAVTAETARSMIENASAFVATMEHL